jgi:hypothetical protein
MLSVPNTVSVEACVSLDYSAAMAKVITNPRDFSMQRTPIKGGS